MGDNIEGELKDNVDSKKSVFNRFENIYGLNKNNIFNKLKPMENSIGRISELQNKIFSTGVDMKIDKLSPSGLENISKIGKALNLSSSPLKNIIQPHDNFANLASVVKIKNGYSIKNDICKILGLRCETELSNDTLIVYGNQNVVYDIDLKDRINSDGINKIVLKDLIFNFEENNYSINDVFKIFSKEIEGFIDTSVLNISVSERKSITTKLDIRFENCDFKEAGLSDIKDINFKNKVEFINCYFNNVNFDDCIFNGDFILDYINNTSSKKIEFNSVKFNKFIVLENFNHSDNELVFNKCIFDDNCNFSIANLNNCKEIKFINLSFNKNFIFENDFTDYRVRLIFKKIIFNDVLDFKYITFCNHIDFNNVEFNKKVNFFYACFAETVYFTNSVFKDDIQLWNLSSLFHKNMADKYHQNIEVNSDFNFENCVFYHDIQFYGINFLKSIIIENSIFSNMLKIVNCNFENELVLRNCSFENSFIINSSTLKQGADFSNTSFKGLVSLYNSDFLEVPNFLSSILEKVTNINLVDVEISQDKLDNFLKDKDCCNINDIKKYKENYRIFKDNLLKNNNNIEASKYKILELLAIEKELDYKMKNKSQIQAKEIFDLLFLKLNRVTSDHHTDFLKIFLFTLSVIGGYFIANLYNELFVYDDKFFYILPSFVFLAFLSGIFIVSKKAKKIACSWYLMSFVGLCGIFYSPSIITPFLGAFSEDARNHYLYKAIDELDSQKALELSRQILAKEPTSELNAKKTLKDYKDELKSSKLLEKSPELKRAVAIDGGVSRLNIAYYLVLAFCIFALQKTMRKNSIIPS